MKPRLPLLAKIVVHETCTSGAVFDGSDKRIADRGS